MSAINVAATAAPGRRRLPLTMQLRAQLSPSPWRECSIEAVRRTLVILLAVGAMMSVPASASAAPVLVLGSRGHVTRRDDPYLSAQSPAPIDASAPGPAAVFSPLALAPGSGAGSPTPAPTAGPPKGTRHKRHKPAVTVASVLAAMLSAGVITTAQRQATLGAFDAALATESHLSGTRRSELADVTTTVHEIAVDGALSPSRLPAIIATLNANRQWWSSGALLSDGERVEFAGSELVWEYYPGQGIQLQVLGSFGKANGLWQAGVSEYPAMEQLLAEIIPLASQRGGGLTWEYYFDWQGGSPPWTSAMSQATGLQALSHAYLATHNPYYLTIAAQAIGIFTHTPAQGGVMIRTPRGVRFIQYTFTPSTAIINAFLQTLIGLHEYATVSGSPLAAGLFAEGNAEAEAEVPRYNTGAWSLYQPGEEDDLSYHELVTGFLSQMCTITAAPVYCTTAQAFTADLTTPPVIRVLTARTRASKPFSLRFSLSKISRVGLTIRHGTTVLDATSATFAHGVQTIAVPKLKPGTDTVTLTATDLAGNNTRAPATTLTVSR
jgi:hypothetical protein